MLIKGDIISDPLDGGIPPSEKGAPNGVCPLNASTLIDLIYLPSSIVSGLKPMGGWDCSGGTYPVAPDVGEFYWCTVPGIIDGTDYQLQDWLVYVATGTWQKIDNTESGITMRTDTILAGEVPSITDFPTWIDGDRGIAVGNTTKRSFLCWLIVMPGVPPTREIQFVALDNAIWKPDMTISSELPEWSNVSSWENNTKGFIINGTGRVFLASRFADMLYYQEFYTDDTNKFCVAKQIRTAPPALPAEGDKYIIHNAVLPPWNAHNNEMVVWRNGAWEYITPKQGWVCYLNSTGGVPGNFWVFGPGNVWLELERTLTAGYLVGFDSGVDGRLLNGPAWAKLNAEYIGLTPPVTPVEGGYYLIQNGATGIWLGKGGKLGYYTTLGGWAYTTPLVTDVWTSKSTPNFYFSNGATWVLLWTLANHSNLQGVTADQHHSQAHTHGGDGSGSELTRTPSVITYFVSNNGNDTTGIGTIYKPFKTIQKAIDVGTALYTAIDIYLDASVGDSGLGEALITIPAGKMVSIFGCGGAESFWQPFANVRLNNGCLFAANNIQFDKVDGSLVLIGTEAYCLLEQCEVQQAAISDTYIKYWLWGTTGEDKLGGVKYGLGYRIGYAGAPALPQFYDDLDLNAHKLLDVQAGTSSTDGINKGQLDETLGCSIAGDDVESIANDTWTKLGTDFGITEEWDDGGFHSTVTNPGRITVPTGKAGKYEVKAHIVFAGHATGLRGLRFYKNNAVQTLSELKTNPAGAEATAVEITRIFNLAVGDYIEIGAYQNSGAAMDISGGVSSMQMIKCRGA